ncbi:MAG: DUF4272 domain-containing protein [Myxococcota bacterium]
MAASRKPLSIPDEPTQKDARALPAPKQFSTGRGRRLTKPEEPSGRHHLVAEGTGSGLSLALREEAGEARPHARHAVPSEVTAGRGVALKFGEEPTAKGAAVQEAPGAAAGARARAVASLGQATAEASRAKGRRRVDTQDETRPEGRAGDSGARERSAAAAARTRDSAAVTGATSAWAETGADTEAFDEGAAEAESGEDSEDSEDEPGAPPEADAVALRALAVAALVQRGLYEARPNNASEVRQLQGWVDAFGLFAGFGAGAFELFDAKHGTWTPEDRAAVAWTAEELRLLLWALRLEPALPSTFERSDAKGLLKKLPLLEPPHAFISKAEVREPDELDVMRAFYEVVLEAARCEVWARGILHDASLAAADDEELEGILSAAEAEGFDRAGLTKAKGAAAAAVAGLRAWTRSLLTSLFEAGSPHAALAFDPGALEAMSDQALAKAFAIARTRSGALEWLTEGEAWDFGDEDAGEGDDAAADDAG